MTDEQTAFVTRNLNGDWIEVVPRKVYDRVVKALEDLLIAALEREAKRQSAEHEVLA